MAMFENCETLKELDLSSFDTSNAYWFNDMFEDCVSLEILTLGEKFVIPSGSRTDGMFSGCNKLDKTRLPAQLCAVWQE